MLDKVFSLYIRRRDCRDGAGRCISCGRPITFPTCAEENKIVNWLDRINRTCVHQSDNLRTQLSFEKEQIRQMGYNT